MHFSLELEKERERILQGNKIGSEFFALILRRAWIRKLKEKFQKKSYQPDLKKLSDKILWEEVWEELYLKSNQEQE